MQTARRPKRTAAAALASVALSLACEREGPEAAKAEVPAEDPATAAELAPRVFDLHGAPGPWSRPGATQLDFDAESRACLARSREARQQAEPDARADAAYRAFLDCMEAGSWRRGGRAPGPVTAVAPR